MPRIEELAADLKRRKGPLLVCTGAGVSLASGISTFRGSDPGAVWSVDVMEMGTYRFFVQNPVESWRWYQQRFDGLHGKQPNAAHHALVDLEHWKREGSRLNNFILVTQNIDGLHRRAGSRSLIEVHGSAEKVRCCRSGCENAAPHGTLPYSDFSADFARFRAAPVLENLPRCPACDSLLRPHVLWFDEYYNEHDEYQYSLVIAAAEQASMVLFVGTSFSVGVTAALLHSAAQRRVPCWSLDPSGEQPNTTTQVLPLKAEEALPALVQLCK